MYNGLINVYKEAGYTSSDVVARLRGILKMRKIGHTGTLDPDAVGVLVVCVGNGTKLCDMLTDHDKEYIAVCRLGVTTDTQDMSGRVLSESEVDGTSEKLHEVVKRFVGEYDQIPPMYSAIKVGGKKLYELARAGKEVERKPRRINIESITILDESKLPSDHIFTMEVKCSKGTYIRTLCNDIGEALGCGAAMEHLTRTAVGSFHLETALTLDEIEKKRDEGTVEEIVASTESLFRDLDYCIIKDSHKKIMENGGGFKAANVLSQAPADEQDKLEEAEAYSDGARVRAYSENKEFFGIYKYDARTETFKVEKFFYNN